jgi:hypothetical protein
MLSQVAVAHYKAQAVYFFEKREFALVLGGCDSRDAFFFPVSLQFLIQHFVPDEPTAPEGLCKEYHLRIGRINTILIRF